MNGQDLLESLWVEKYRPKSLNDVVMHEKDKKGIEKCLEKGDIPHLLFIGPQGSGKCHDGDELIDIYIEE